MIVTIHQPSYLPWIPFLEKGLRSDVYVLLDNVQFEKNSEQNRNRIKTAQGPAWLTVPVVRSITTLIMDVTIPPTESVWARKHRRMIEENYRKAPHFKVVSDRLFPILEQPWTHLCELNDAIDRLFLQWAGFTGRIVRARDLDVDEVNWLRILKICKTLGATTYLSGVGGLDYMNVEAFDEAGIKILFQKYHHAEYPQMHPKLGFLPNLSALDFFMNVGVGEAARDFILKNSHWYAKAELETESST